MRGIRFGSFEVAWPSSVLSTWFVFFAACDNFQIELTMAELHSPSGTFPVQLADAIS